jgi:diguanylate cyclase (GGDEF)-like protein
MSIKGAHSLSKSFEELLHIAKKIRVLYVEDDPLIRQEFSIFLHRFFPSVTTATNGEEGQERALNECFDLIISDIKMPKKDGLEMIQAIKEHIPTQATLLLSAHQEISMLHRSVELGIDGYLFKPIKPQQTVETLTKVCSKILMERENLLYKQHLETMIALKNKELTHQYMTDKITGLYTLGKLEQDIVSTTKQSLALIKISDFKSLNDFYGYDIGNKVLQQTAVFLQSMTEPHENAKLYRISGAHFALVIDLNSDDLERYIRYIIHMYESTEIQVDNEKMYLEMVAGIMDGDEPLSLSNADIALREAEQSGKVVVYAHNDQKSQLQAEKIKCKDIIKRGLIEDRFVPFYQPIVDNTTKKIIKYEALARLILPDGGVINPGCFLEVSKETKTYAAISQSIISKAMEDFKDSECSISINLDLEDIKNFQMREFLFSQITRFPEPERLVFELLESEGISSYEHIDHFLDRLKSFGCRIAIDDFGAGYSNFERLAKLNIDYIKIDGSLIMNIDESFLSQTIVEMVASFADIIKIKTIAEFVSNPSIESMVVSMGVDESQGYLFGQAIPYNRSMRFIQ